MLNDGIIFLSDWISLILVKDKKSRDNKIYVHLWSLNATCVRDLFATSFTDELLENVGGREAYSFTDIFLRYHQVRIV